ncbi:hypothetical protein [Sphaerisporangium corydalis]|uniref:Guanylate cyclase domain-containing protein n=1 Tax=Sphaerisporangium corydalis TaxID=1441875 RepID=A0ABV9EQ32_9ACTN|nr:hypothetical protein [Sphaerisporangium corydalis]
MVRTYERRLVLAVHAHGYDKRTALMQRLTGESLGTAFDAAAGRAGLGTDQWHRTREGHRLLAVLPVGAPEPLVTDHFVQQVHIAIREHNRLVATEGRLRLRLAIHFGMVGGNAESGFDGPAPVEAHEMAGCRGALEVLDRSEADLVVVVSKPIFEDTIAGQLTSLETRDLRKLHVHGRDAWLWAPGCALPDQTTGEHDAHADEDGAASSDGGVGDEKQGMAGAAPKTDTPRRPSVSTFTKARINMRGGQIAGGDIHNHGGDR